MIIRKYQKRVLKATKFTIHIYIYKYSIYIQYIYIYSAYYSALTHVIGYSQVGSNVAVRDNSGNHSLWHTTLLLKERHRCL